MNKTGKKPTNTWVSLCSVTKRLAEWGELLRVRLGVRFPSGVPRRSKLCIACSDLFYKSEYAHAAAPPFQLRPAIAELAVGVPPCGRHILFLTEISILTIPSQKKDRGVERPTGAEPKKKDMTYGHVFLLGFCCCQRSINPFYNTLCYLPLCLAFFFSCRMANWRSFSASFCSRLLVFRSSLHCSC